LFGKLISGVFRPSGKIFAIRLIRALFPFRGAVVNFRFFENARVFLNRQEIASLAIGAKTSGEVVYRGAVRAWILRQDRALFWIWGVRSFLGW
jgi:hypothetical protein